MRLFIFIFLSVFLLSPNAEAKQKKCWLQYQSQKLLAKECRLEFALLLKEHFTNMDNAIPALSPKEDTWLKNEISSSNSNRGFQALESIEYVKKDSKEYFSKISSLANDILKPDNTLNEEIVHWTHLYRLTMVFDEKYNLNKLINDNTVQAKQLSFYPCSKDPNFGKCSTTYKKLFLELVIFDKIIMPFIENKQ